MTTGQTLRRPDPSQGGARGHRAVAGRTTRSPARAVRPTVVPITRRSAPSTRTNGRPARAQNGRAGGAGANADSHGETPQVRGARTRRRIAEAVISLMEEQGSPPTAKEIAARAGVSVRLVFHHFDDMDALYKMVITVQIERHWLAATPPPPELPLDKRIDRTVAQRAKLFDTIGPVRRKGMALMYRYPDIAAGLASTDRTLHEWTSVTFAPELGVARGERRDLQAALDAALSFETWDRLRSREGLSVAAARRVVARTVRALLAVR